MLVIDGTRASWARVPIILLNYTCWWSVPRWTKKKGYSSSPSSSTPKSGRCLIITQTVSLGQIFHNLMLMGHFGLIYKGSFTADIFESLWAWMISQIVGLDLLWGGLKKLITVHSPKSIFYRKSLWAWSELR